VWPLVVDGEVYVRAANGQQSSWYAAAMNQNAGRIQVGGKDYEVAAQLLFAALGFNLGVAAVGLHRAMTQPED
jgi:hypothetical protein